MLERRSFVKEGTGNPLAQGYTEFRSLYRAYQEAALTIDRRYVPQVLVRKNGDKHYYFPAVERMFDERTKKLEKEEASFGNENGNNPLVQDERRMQLEEKKATLQYQKDNFKDFLTAQWEAFERLCNKIANNVYVKDFYHKPLFTFQQESYIGKNGTRGVVFYPTQESRLSQYRVPDGLVYYNGKPYQLNDDWDAKRQQILTKLLSFENPFP